MAKITPEEAMQRISTSQDKKRAKAVKPMEFVRAIGESTDSLYVFRRGDSATITTSDSDLPPVIGETEDADFTQDLPPCMEDWLDGYANEVEWWQTVGHTLPEDDAEYGAAERKDVPFMVDTKWGQGTPWNNKLDFGGGKCVVGCTATAAAQIIRYWGRKGLRRGCTATAAYTTSANKYKVAALPPKAVFDFANMPVGTPKTAAEIEAEAVLCEYVGKAFKCNYTPGATGAYTSDVAAAMKKQFRMGGMIQLLYASSLGYTRWEAAVYEAIASGQPVLMSGGGDKGRHMFICDGYNATTDRYHYNWGWSGKYDGWYAMTVLNPRSGYTFNSQKRAIIGIEPAYVLGDVNGDGEVSVADVMAVADHVLNQTYSEQADVNSDGKVSITDATLVADKILGKSKF